VQDGLEKGTRGNRIKESEGSGDEIDVEVEVEYEDEVGDG
jgi:hypothetical protein